MIKHFPFPPVTHESYGVMQRRSILQRLHVDLPLLIFILLLASYGLAVLYSATNQNAGVVSRQVIHMMVGLLVMFLIAQMPPRMIERLTPIAYFSALFLLILVLAIGDTSKGAQRWLALGGFRFQPSEMMKLALPMMVAWDLSQKNLPPNTKEIFVTILYIAIPTLLIMKQPDLGTSLLIAASGFFGLFFAGLRWKLIFATALVGISALPGLWFFMHDYQKQRVLTFLDPERDPLGAGWNIIQSKIAIGSGGLFGKGWLNGTQVHLDFLPEQSTDFIFAVCSEEFGLLGVFLLLLGYLAFILRGLQIGVRAQDTYTRLLAGSLTLIFGFYVVINVGMVSGLLPVVGLPLPLISYGGTSVVTLFASFGILMSIQTHKRLVRH